MSRQSSLVAGFINPLAMLLICANGASAFTNGETNSIVTCVENDRAGTVTLNTRSRSPIPAPQVSYLPGEGGEIIMTADFDGLVCSIPTRIIKINTDSPRAKGIREIRIGQLQPSPPVCRISVITTEGRALKTLNFKSVPGSLIIKWPVVQAEVSDLSATRRHQYDSSRLEAPRYEPPSYSPRQSAASYSQAAPQPSLEQNPEQPSGQNQEQYRVSSQTPPLAPSIRSYGYQKAPVKAPRIVDSPNPPESNSYDQEQTALSSSDLLGQPQAEPKKARSEANKNRIKTERNSTDRTANQSDDKKPTEWIEDPPDLRPAIGTGYNGANAPLISLTMEKDPSTSDKSNAVFRLKIKSDHSLTYSTFRLSNPERYVIDFANCPELANAQLPDAQDSEFIRSIRVGQPDDPTKTRLVIDLINEPVAIKEQVQREANLLTIRLSRSVEVADRAASQISVPSGMSIVLDAGHGGSDPGAQRGDVQEKEITLGIIERLKRRLESKGFHITLTRFDDTFVSLEDRVRITNSLQPTLFLSVHINAMESANDIHGIETYYQTEQSRALADAIHENLVTKLDAPDRAVRKARFYVINHTPVPAVLAEVGFISNRDERDKLISSDYQNKVATALEQGVMLYLDKQLARGRADPSRASDSSSYTSFSSAGISANNGSGTMKTSGRSNNQSNRKIAQRKYQFEDSAR